MVKQVEVCDFVQGVKHFSLHHFIDSLSHVF